jgi:hypothetical protein
MSKILKWHKLNRSKINWITCKFQQKFMLILFFMFINNFSLIHCALYRKVSDAPRICSFRGHFASIESFKTTSCKYVWYIWEQTSLFIQLICLITLMLIIFMNKHTLCLSLLQKMSVAPKKFPLHILVIPLVPCPNLVPVIRI